MAIKSKTRIGFSRMKDDELMVTATTVVGAMTDNANFPDPIPALTAVQELLDDFADKLAAARKRGSPEDTAIKDESREPLIDALQQLSYYVNTIAKGRLSVVLSSGLPTHTKATESLIPLAVGNVRVSDGRQSGQVRLDFDTQKNVRLYEYCYRKVQLPEVAWSDRFTTSSSRMNIIAPLEVSQYYEFKVRAINSKGPSDWSNTVRILVR